MINEDKLLARIYQLESENDDLHTALEVTIEEKNLKIKELESELQFLDDGYEPLIDELWDKWDTDNENKQLKDKNERLLFSLIHEQHRNL